MAYSHLQFTVFGNMGNIRLLQNFIIRGHFDFMNYLPQFLSCLHGHFRFQFSHLFDYFRLHLAELDRFM